MVDNRCTGATATFKGQNVKWECSCFSAILGAALFLLRSSDTREANAGAFNIRTYVRVREWQKGQTMTEYALILSAVAVVVYLGYQTMGTTISSSLVTVDTSL